MRAARGCDPGAGAWSRLFARPSISPTRPDPASGSLGRRFGAPARAGRSRFHARQRMEATPKRAHGRACLRGRRHRLRGPIPASGVPRAALRRARPATRTYQIDRRRPSEDATPQQGSEARSLGTCDRVAAACAGIARPADEAKPGRERDHMARLRGAVSLGAAAAARHCAASLARRFAGVPRSSFSTACQAVTFFGNR
jgi:hypothetical protein